MQKGGERAGDTEASLCLCMGKMERSSSCYSFGPLTFRRLERGLLCSSLYEILDNFLRSLVHPVFLCGSLVLAAWPILFPVAAVRVLLR